MAEYIVREALLDRIRGTGYAEPIKSNLLVMAVTIPAADVRPVVTCAECKHWTRIKKDCILASCDLDALVRCEDFYCANGEKREES